jgi:putative copper resistance protein D
LVQITHNVIGLLAVIVACGRWLELRLTPPAGRLAGVVSVSGILLIGLILLFYRETPGL